MKNELTCGQILALMSFYIGNNLTPKLKSYVDDHLKDCKECREAYLNAKSDLEIIIDIESTSNNSSYQEKQYENFVDNLSAYIDNELDSDESVRIKKFVISNPAARQKLENMYTFRNIMQNSFEKTKNELKTDYSKRIINVLSNGNELKADKPFVKLAGAFTVMVLAIIIGFLTLLSYS